MNHSATLQVVTLALSTVLVFSTGCRRPATPQAAVPSPAVDDVKASSIAEDLANRLGDGAGADWLAASNVKLKEWRRVADLPVELAQFDTVFWDAGDTESLRQWIRAHKLDGLRVMEIGAGTGLISLCCLQANAGAVVATDINPNALANLYYNAERMGFLDPSRESSLDLRWVSTSDPGAYSVLQPDEKFDLIVSNPPWEDQKPKNLAEFAFYDEDFRLLESLLAGLQERLTSGGQCLLAYGCREAIRTVLRRAEHHGLQAEVLDERNLEELPEVFVPGMLIVVKPQQPAE